MQRTNFAWLFVGILLLLLLAPVLELGGIHASAVFEGAFTSLLLLGVWSLRSVRPWFGVAVGLAMANLISLAVYLGTSHSLWTLFANVSLLGFCLVSAFLAIRTILFSARSDVGHLMAALSVYLLLGVIWALLYAILRYVDPTALANVVGPPGLPGAGIDVLYFSFVTLTTLGYGDITPATSLAKSLTILEAVIGQLFLAVLIASLVGRIGSRKN